MGEMDTVKKEVHKIWKTLKSDDQKSNYHRDNYVYEGMTIKDICTRYPGSIIENNMIIFDNQLIRYIGTEKHISIPMKVSHILNNAFENCNEIEVVVLHDNVESIGKYAFIDCNNLKQVIAKNCSPLISPLAFWGCTCLSENYNKKGMIFIGKTLYKYHYYSRSDGNMNVIVPEDTRVINYEAFSHTTSLWSDLKQINYIIVDCRNVKNCLTICGGAFRATNISEIFFPQHVKLDFSFSDLQLIAHSRCLKRIHLSDNIEYDIAKFGFRGIVKHSRNDLFWEDPKLEIYISPEKYELLKKSGKEVETHETCVEIGYPLDWYELIEEIHFYEETN